MSEEVVEQSTKADRPISITLISLYLIISNLLLVWYLFRGTLLQGKGIGEFIYLALGMGISLVCGIGFWMMKKWAVYIFTVFFVLNQIALLLLGRWNVFSLLFTATVVFFGYRNLAKMS